MFVCVHVSKYTTGSVSMYNNMSMNSYYKQIYIFKKKLPYINKT